jgi:hypothetical protein
MTGLRVVPVEFVIYRRNRRTAGLYLEKVTVA